MWKLEFWFKDSAHWWTDSKSYVWHEWHWWNQCRNGHSSLWLVRNALTLLEINCSLVFTTRLVSDSSRENVWNLPWRLHGATFDLVQSLGKEAVWKEWLKSLVRGSTLQGVPSARSLPGISSGPGFSWVDPAESIAYLLLFKLWDFSR